MGLDRRCASGRSGIAPRAGGHHLPRLTHPPLTPSFVIRHSSFVIRHLSFSIPLFILFLAFVLWILSRRVSDTSGLPAGRVVYSDMGNAQAWGRVERPLFSQRLQLTGKPDYLVRDGDAVIPVEVKSGRAPADGPYDSHIFQLAAYCALAAEAYGRRPSHGLIKYADKIFAVDYTPQLESELMTLLDEIRRDADSDDAHRSHDSAARCRACGFREVCGEEVRWLGG